MPHCRQSKVVARARGYPDILVVDCGPDLRGPALDAWAGENGVQLYFIDPGKPTQNAYIESFNGRFRDQGLNHHWSISIADARKSSKTGGSATTQNAPTAA